MKIDLRNLPEDLSEIPLEAIPDLTAELARLDSFAVDSAGFTTRTKKEESDC